MTDKDLRNLWDLDSGQLIVNHGSYGAAPRIVLAEQQRWRSLLEAAPTRFFVATLPPALRSSADILASYLGAAGKDLVFVDNASAGMNAVMRSLSFAPGDEILMLSHVYGAVRQTVNYLAQRTGIVPVFARLPFPDPTVPAILAAIEAAITPRTRLAAIDHITSPSALVLPIAEIAELCRARHIPLLVDGAHGPGQVPVNLTAINADFYVGNCHKWLMAPKGAAFLWVKPDQQAGLHPLVISYGFDTGFLNEFDWTGTRDPSAALSVPAAIAFHNDLGGPALMAANRDLAWQGINLLARRLGAQLGAGPDFFAAMAILEIPRSGPASIADAKALRAALIAANADAPVFCIDGRLWLRISAQAYNRLDHYRRLAELLVPLLK